MLPGISQLGRDPETDTFGSGDEGCGRDDCMRTEKASISSLAWGRRVGAFLEERSLHVTSGGRVGTGQGVGVGEPGEEGALEGREATGAMGSL